jgi:hypothetical protein
MNFNTIVFINCENSFVDQVKAELRIDQNLFVFVVHLSDELLQLINQSSKTFVILDKMQSLTILYGSNISKQANKSIRYYFYDEFFKLQDVDIAYLKKNSIYNLNPNSMQNLINKVELFFYGKIKTLGQGHAIPIEQDPLKQKYYLTLISTSGQQHKIHISSHLAQSKISKIIGIDVETLIEDICINSGQYQALSEKEVEKSNFIQLIYPAWHNSTSKIAIVHLRKSDDLVQSKNKILSLVESLLKS